MKKQVGVGLFEIMIVLAVISAIMAISLMQYRHQLWRKNIVAIETSEALLQQAATDFWFQNCHDFSGPTNLPLNEVLEMLPANERNEIKNPWSIPGTEVYTIQLITQEDPGHNDDKRWLIKVNTTIDKSADAVKAIAADVGAVAKGSQISWVFTPRQTPKKMDARLGVLSTSYGYYTAKSNELSNNQQYNYCSPWVS